MLRLSISLILLIALSGCTWFEGDSSPTQARPAGSNETSSDRIEGTTMADRRLERIYNKQQRVITDLTERPEDFAATERDRLLDNLLSEYQSFVFENPDYVYGYILYGKLLRQVGDREAANIAFTKANQLDPSIPVVKQQIGNYLAEEGQWEQAIFYFNTAVELAPDNALYQYQLGELLYQNGDAIMREGMPQTELDNAMLAAFSEAARLDPSNRTFKMRYAESFFDVQYPDWNVALAYWNQLESDAESPLERDIIRLQKARVLIAQTRYNEARSLLVIVDQPGLENSKQNLLMQIP